MANRVGRGRGIVAKRQPARKRRVLTIRPKADRLWLLAGTAIITGAVMWPTHPAMATCTYDYTQLDCTDDAGIKQLSPVDWFVGIDTFDGDIGDDDTVGTIQVGETFNEALEVTSDTSYPDDPFSGTIDITEGSSILHEGTTSGGAALYIHYVDTVTVTNNGTVFDADALSNPGTNGAILFDAFNSMTVINNGHIESDDAAGISGSNGGVVTVVNNSPSSLLGFTVGIDQNNIDALRHVNSGGVTLGETVDGVQVTDIEGDSFVPNPTLVDLNPIFGPDPLVPGIPIPDSADFDGAQISFLIVNNSQLTTDGSDVDSFPDLLDGGLIGGNFDGVYGSDFWNGDIVIANNGYWEDDPAEKGLRFRDGGMIVGEEDDGIELLGMADNVFIDNSNTQSSEALRHVPNGDLDPETLAFLDAINDDSDGETVIDDISDVPVGFAAGIWGDDNGIVINGLDRDIDGDVDDAAGVDARYVGIDNINGLVGGRFNDGIQIGNLIGEDWHLSHSSDETLDAVGILNGAGGVIWGGGSDGIDLFNLGGDVYINNAGSSDSDFKVSERQFGEDFDFMGGTIFGEDNGIRIVGIGEQGVDVDGGGDLPSVNFNAGNVLIRNSQGEVTGYGEDGIFIDRVNGAKVTGDVDVFYGYAGGHVAILNGTQNQLLKVSSGPVWADGGRIYGEDSAIQIGADFFDGGDDNGQGALSAFIANGRGGLIAGNGDWDRPVIYLDLSTASGLGFDGIDDDGGGPDDAVADDVAAGAIENDGIMSSYELPTFWFQGAVPLPGEGYDWGNEDDVFEADLDAFHNYVVNGGSKDQFDFDNLLDDRNSLAAYKDAADDMLVWGEDGAVELTNNNFMAGRLMLHSYNDDSGGGDNIGNTVVNNGTWFVTDDRTGMMGVFGTDIDAISDEDNIANNNWMQIAFGPGEDSGTFDVDTFFNGTSDFADGPVQAVVSMVDGDGEDSFNIESTFQGVSPEEYDAGYRSLVAMDVFFQDVEQFQADIGGQQADRFDIEDNLNGTTGLILRRANDGPTAPNALGDVIFIGEAHNSVQNYCNGIYCAPGDAIYIDPGSDGFYSNNGVGFTDQGLNAWAAIQNASDTSDDEKSFYLLAIDSPGEVNAPKVATGAQAIGKENFEIVSRHNYGGQFGGGSGGADLSPDVAVEDAAPQGTDTRTGLWAQVGGSVTDRDTTFVDEVGFPFDTGSSQQIYSILGGADMKWNADSSLRLGVFGGYVTSSMDLDLGNDSVDYEGGVAGAYLAYNDGAFYADATLKSEFLAVDYDFGGVSVDADAMNIGVAANTGYRFAMGNSFVEPLASVVYIHSDVDNFSQPGETVTFSNADSLRGGVGARIGTAFATGGATTQLTLLGRVWNEFEDANEVTVTSGGNSVTYEDDISGLYGEVEGEVLVTSSDGTLSSFLSASGEFGDDYTSYGAKAGVRKGF